MNITVYLGANEGNDPSLRKAVRELGTWIGESGNRLVYGGSKSGLMGEIAESVLQAGGEVTGVGLGRSVEKLHWLPEAHTDFLFSVIGEEFGFVGLMVLIFAFYWLMRRMTEIGREAIILDRVFSGLVAQGVAIWMGFQAFINMGVNLGALPTKGLTLPLMSFGGSGIVANCIALAILLRVDWENRQLMRGGKL